MQLKRNENQLLFFFDCWHDHTTEITETIFFFFFWGGGGGGGGFGGGG